MRFRRPAREPLTGINSHVYDIGSGAVASEIEYQYDNGSPSGFGEPATVTGDWSIGFTIVFDDFAQHATVTTNSGTLRVDGQNEKVRFLQFGSADKGGFIIYGDTIGYLTGLIEFDATAEEIEAAIESNGGLLLVVVTGNQPDPAC